MGLLAYAVLLTVVAIAFIVFVHLNNKEMMKHVVEAYQQSVHAHDDASVRIADHRRLDNERIKIIGEWGETMAKSSSELSQFVLADVNRSVTPPPPPEGLNF